MNGFKALEAVTYLFVEGHWQKQFILDFGTRGFVLSQLWGGRRWVLIPQSTVRPQGRVGL